MRKGDYTREMVIERAAALLNQRGFYAASMSDIMAATGLKKGGIYNHFASKEELIGEAFRYCVERMDAHFEHVMEGERHPVDRLAALLSAARDLYRGVPVPGGCAVMNAAIESDDAHPFLKARARQAMDGFLGKIESIVERGIASGGIRADADARETALFVVSSLEGAIMLSKLSGSEQAIETAVRQLKRWMDATLRHNF